MNRQVIICPTCRSIICPRCGSEMVLRNGKYGEFYGCSNHPTCSYSLNEEIVDKEMKRRAEERRMAREDEKEKERMKEFLRRECPRDSELEDYDEDGVYIGPGGDFEFEDFLDWFEVEKDEGTGMYRLKR